jgi:non-ribosomal peptide synthetase component F
VIQPEDIQFVFDVGCSFRFDIYLEFLKDTGATVVTMCAAVWRQFVKYVVQHEPVLPSSLCLIVTGGESILTSVLKSWLGTVGEYPRFVNTYGPTEATVSISYYYFCGF